MKVFLQKNDHLKWKYHHLWHKHNESWQFSNNHDTKQNVTMSVAHTVLPEWGKSKRRQWGTWDEMPRGCMGNEKNVRLKKWTKQQTIVQSNSEPNMLMLVDMIKSRNEDQQLTFCLTEDNIRWPYDHYSAKESLIMSLFSFPKAWWLMR